MGWSVNNFYSSYNSRDKIYSGISFPTYSTLNLTNYTNFKNFLNTILPTLDLFATGYVRFSDHKFAAVPSGQEIFDPFIPGMLAYDYKFTHQDGSLFSPGDEDRMLVYFITTIKRVQNYSIKVTSSPQSLCSLKETAFTKISGFRKYTL